MANVLIVDDDSDTVECSRELLESAGHKIQTGYNGEDGLKSLDAGPLPDCILLDVDMPVLNGPGMAHQMLLHDAGEERIPILLVSGRRDLPEVAGRWYTLLVRAPQLDRKRAHVAGGASKLYAILP